MKILFGLLLAGCIDEPPRDVYVSWQTQGRSSTVPEEEVGVRVFYFGDDLGGQTSDWVMGYDGATRVTVREAGSTSEVCLRLQRRQTILTEQFGQEVVDYDYTAMSEMQCKDVPVDSSSHPGSFELVLTGT